MTEARAGAEAPEATEPTPEDAGAPQAPPEARDADAQARSREAAGYRVKLREAEQALAERDAVIGALRERIDTVDRVEVERLAEQRGMASGSDLWTVAELADLRSEDGALDAEKVAERVDKVLRERPHWKRARVDLGAGARATVPQDQTPGLSRLLGKR